MPARPKEGLTVTVGRNVKRIRERCGMSQVALAAAIEAHQGTISAIESGDRGTSMLMLKKIADALGVPATSLFKETKGKEIA